MTFALVISGDVFSFFFGKHWTHLVAGSSGSQSPAGAFANA